jgi:hypothetical protein
MRFVHVAALAVMVGAPVASAHADDIDAATLAKVTEVAAKGYAHPEAAKVTNIRKSLATSGTGYCGEITLEGSEQVTTFHVILETPKGPTVLRLVDFDTASGDPKVSTVHEFFKHVGCIK